MNKKIAWSVMVSVGLALSACGTVDQGDSGPNTGVTPQTSGMSDTEGMNDTENQQDTGVNTGGQDTGTMDETGNAETGGIGFIEDPDGGGISFECDIFAQDCPEGEKCMPWANDGGGAWNATRCSPISDNPGQSGDPCTVEGSGTSGIDDCDIGVMCWDVDPKTNVGTCVDMCTGDDTNPICEDPDTACAIANNGAIVLCLPACDPLLQDCVDGQACYPVNEDWLCAPDASGPDLGAYADPCEFLNVCDPGLICVDAAAVPDCPAGTAGCCTEVCDLSDPAFACSGAAGGQSCEAWYVEGMEPPGYEDVGVCAIPA